MAALRADIARGLAQYPGWHTAYYSPPVTNDYRVDPGERLSWSPDSRRLYFRMYGKTLWGYDFVENRSLWPGEL